MSRLPTIELVPEVLAPDQERAAGGLLAARPLAFIGIVLSIAFATCVYGLRTDGIFACQAAGYGPQRYLSYCQASSYGDYDHGAFWFGLEPGAVAAATDADVLFLGNSRMQLAFSTEATAEWFASVPVSYYLLGFSHNGNVHFADPLLQKLKPRAKVYVVNLDLFFESNETSPVRTVLHDPGSRSRYEQKRSWQGLHRVVCSRAAWMCRDEHTFFRSMATGAWIVAGGELRPEGVSYADEIDTRMFDAYRVAGAPFLEGLPAPRECVILTMVPTVRTTSGTAMALAGAFGLRFVAPRPDSLETFDQSHMDRSSAERWSAAFFTEAGPQIRKCLADAEGLPAPAPAH